MSNSIQPYFSSFFNTSLTHAHPRLILCRIRLLSIHQAFPTILYSNSPTIKQFMPTPRLRPRAVASVHLRHKPARLGATSNFNLQRGPQLICHKWSLMIFSSPTSDRTEKTFNLNFSLDPMHVNLISILAFSLSAHLQLRLQVSVLLGSVNSTSNVLNLRFSTKLTQDFAMLPTPTTIFTYSPAGNIFRATVFMCA
ncbi:hypothetical protein FB451DRAFT_1394082 [Mycena latifolia]|nr:hypothetical protein FB451DRAFT_1394082 [Mycena latifolia]